MPEILDERIRSLITELIESTPQAPVLLELEWTDSEPLASVTRVPRRPRPSRVVVGGFAGAVAAILVVALLVPVVTERHGRSSKPTAPKLSNGKWLYRAQQLSLTLQVSLVGRTPTPAAEARVRGVVKYWANAQNQVCVSITAEPAEFASTTNRTAWDALGLHDLPTPNPWTSCASGGVGAAPPAQLLMDTSRLPTDPAALADQLWKGTTGIPSLDSANSDMTGYERAVLLLVGPTTGSTPALDAALMQALPLIPGVRAFGPMTTHSGDSGVGFADNHAFGLGRSVLVLNPTTGALLEAQNIPLGMFELNGGPLDAYMPEHVAAKGGGGRVTVEWLDPIGPRSVVDARDLPANLSVPPVVHYTASVVGLVKPSVTGNDVPNFDRTLDTRTCAGGYYASAREQDTGTATPITTYAGKLANFPAQLSLYCTGPTAEAASDAQALKASGLFSSIVVTYAGSTPTTTSG